MKCITYDGPAKLFVRDSKKLNSNHGSDKCHKLGTNINGSNCYLETSFTKRTDRDFRNKTYKLNPNCDIPLNRLRIDIVTTFNVDYMHCALIGITKKNLKIFIYPRIKL